VFILAIAESSQFWLCAGSLKMYLASTKGEGNSVMGAVGQGSTSVIVTNYVADLSPTVPVTAITYFPGGKLTMSDVKKE